MPILKEKKYYGNTAMLIAPHDREVFHLKENARAFTYDDYYLIIGNAELRIKAGDKKIFTNFGILNSFIDNRGQKFDLLLGQDETREPEVVGYEMHQVIFENQMTLEYSHPPHPDTFFHDK